jgi:hypothetical protein
LSLLKDELSSQLQILKAVKPSFSRQKTLTEKKERNALLFLFLSTMPE